MAGIVTPVFSLIWFCMLTLYWRIWREAYKHAKQLRASISGLHDGGHSDWKSVQVINFNVFFFTIFTEILAAIIFQQENTNSKASKAHFFLHSLQFQMVTLYSEIEMVKQQLRVIAQANCPKLPLLKEFDFV